MEKEEIKLEDCKFDHIAVISSNIPKSVAWYKKMLKASVIYQDKTWALVECFDTKIAFVSKDEHSAHLAFRVGSTVNFPCSHEDVKKHRDGSSYYYGSDPDGNIIEWIAYTDETE
tara:strand:- start:951 stop:1295 length:345 start_codon:yes stop_codon:yes gene_type:complete